MREWPKVLLACAVVVAAAAGVGAQTVIVDGQPVEVAAMEQDGTVYVEAIAFAEALGASAAYNSLNKKLIVARPTVAGAVGAEQMEGQWAEMGRAYTINRDDPLNFTLISAEFTVTRVNVGDESVVPQGDEKLLMLHMMVQNPQERERRLYWADLELTAVDVMNVNREWSQELGIESTGEPVDMDLKPAQKVDLYTAVVVPAKGPVPKLIVKSGEGGVLRYDLRAKVTPLEEPFRDPEDESGVSARERVMPKMYEREYHPMGLFDVRYGDRVRFLAGPYASAPEGMAYMGIGLMIRNGSGDEQWLHSDLLCAELRALDGRKVDWECELVSEEWEAVDVDFGPGEETGIFAMFRLPVGTPLGSFEIREGEQGRAYVFDLAGAVVQGEEGASSDESGGGGVGEALLEGILGGVF